MSMRCKAAIVAVLAAMMLAVMPVAPVMARIPESSTAALSPQVDPLRAFEPSVGDGRSEVKTGCPDMGAREDTATDLWETPPGSDDVTGTPPETQAPREPSRDDTATTTSTVLPARETTSSPPVTHRFSDHSVMYPDAVGDADATIAMAWTGPRRPT